MTGDAITAGSSFSFLAAMGRRQPTVLATRTAPHNTATLISFHHTANISDIFISFRAIPRIIRTALCEPALPLDKYAQEKVKAIYKNGILRVSIPPKDEPDQNDGIKIEIVSDN